MNAADSPTAIVAIRSVSWGIQPPAVLDVSCPDAARRP
jgi:hypothetical protein